MSKLAVMKGVKFTEKRLLDWLREDGEVILQTKRDEIRCVVRVSASTGEMTYTSAQGKPLFNLNCFDEEWNQVAMHLDLYEFDTGICVNESFELTKRTVRASKKKYDLSGDTHHIIDDRKKTGFYFEGTLTGLFYLYDLPSWVAPYENRRRTMADLAHRFPSLRIPETWRCSTVVQTYETYDQLVNQGYEGLMVKRQNFEYIYGRTVAWMKMKPEDERDGEITGYVEGKGEFEGLIGSIEIRFVDGSTTSVSGMSYALRVAISADREGYIGRIVEVRFMQRDSQGGYRHPKFYRFHPDKTTLEGSE
ncbi:DNA ligase [Yersinia phage phiR8-01]|uniref:DNA ligase n=1 Tax=Yersinia phage phiR8-01 TaxID=1206556 RepID=I7LEA7_9CAUD|nr:DNA ligase [Yersinia phage phiR8-01]CCI88402.2 DNA ligase [Yersinia phage phiR8-01]